MFEALLEMLGLDELPSADDKCHYYTKTLSVEDIESRRAQIYNKFKDYTNVCRLSPKQLKEMIMEYDKVWFGGDLFGYLESKKQPISIKVSGLEDFTTESACIADKCMYTMTLPLHKFAKFDSNKKDGLVKVGGKDCKDHVEGLQIVIEHELVHLIIFMFCGSITVSDEHGTLFKNTVKKLFGHTDIHHYIF